MHVLTKSKLKNCKCKSNPNPNPNPKGKPREAVHQLGVTMGFWAQADQRAPTSRPELISCPYHEREHYRGLAAPLEAAAAVMREERCPHCYGF